MSRTKLQSRITLPAEMSALLIGAGLAILIAAAWIPTLPLITAFSLLALGATDTTIARFNRSPALMPVLLLHATTYAVLYGLFIGAVIYTASSAGQSLGIRHSLDLLASTLFMAMALQRLSSRLRRV